MNSQLAPTEIRLRETTLGQRVSGRRPDMGLGVSVRATVGRHFSDLGHRPPRTGLNNAGGVWRGHSKVHDRAAKRRNNRLTKKDQGEARRQRRDAAGDAVDRRSDHSGDGVGRVNRECETEVGRPKRRYARRRDAKNAIWSMSSPSDGLAPYRCAACGWFHIGHYPSNPLTRRRLRSRHRQQEAS